LKSILLLGGDLVLRGGGNHKKEGSRIIFFGPKEREWGEEKSTPRIVFHNDDTVDQFKRGGVKKNKSRKGKIQNASSPANWERENWRKVQSRGTSLDMRKNNAELQSVS